ncbi:FtsK/SpoIIIE domain-containing protein [Micromonospora sonneratiae]|uniref:FtsK/SpoIIIE domain-containing protein n=1 Tax=Micromonospora sonneratiae TaxID=1184706 RepID=A0ABW3Y8N8_9ACTN
MASLKARVSHAAALHRQAAAAATAAATALDATRPAPADQLEQHDLAERLRTAAAVLVPGWLGAPLDSRLDAAPLGGSIVPAFVRIGTAQPLDDARFPAVVPLLGTGHLTLDADVRDPRVAGLVRAVLLRLLAAAPAGSLLVRGVDAATSGLLFAPFAPLADAGLMPPPATDRAGLQAVLTEAEQWVRPSRPAGAQHRRRDHTLLLVIASLPELTEGADLTRIAALAQHGPAMGLHMIVAGWPPPPLTEETTQPPLPHATMVTLRNPYALVSDPPGASFSGAAPQSSTTGLNSPVFLDEDPPAHLFDRVCRELSIRFDTDPYPGLADLLPDDTAELWTEEAADGLVTTVGMAGDRAVTLRFNELTPHWIIGGRPAAGKTSFLVNVLYGLCSRYAPSQLAIYLVDFTEGGSFTEFAPTGRDHSWLPHVRAVGVEADREYGLAVLRDLDAELSRRMDQGEPVTRSPQDGGSPAGRQPSTRRRQLPRILCVINELQVLTGVDDQVTAEANARLETLARTGRSYGIHLVLTGRTAFGAQAPLDHRDTVIGQFPVRIALPGGGDVLEPTNDAAVGLPLGTAVVNTAGGLGGPRGATRGHERMVRFPNPYADPTVLSSLRHRLWEARPADHPAPGIFAGYAQPQLDDDPTYLAALAGRSDRPAALLGRIVDLTGRTAVFPLDPIPGRHLVILGPDPAGAGILRTAARSVAAHHSSGTARFVVASLTPETDGPATALAGELGQRQNVEYVDLEGLLRSFSAEQPGYLVVFGMDQAAPEGLPTDLLQTLLREGPGRGVHLLSWWRQPRRLVEVLGASVREEINGMVLLDVPSPEVDLLLGGPTGSIPRPGRALLYASPDNQPTVIIPYLDEADHRRSSGNHSKVGHDQASQPS